MAEIDKIVFDKLETSGDGWKFEAHLELSRTDALGATTDAFEKAFAAPVDLPILTAHDHERQIGRLRGDGSGEFTGTINATLCHSMELGIGFKPKKSRIEDEIRILEEVELFEVSLFPIEARPTRAGFLSGAFKCAKCSAPVEISEAELDRMEKESVFAKSNRRGEAVLYCRACTQAEATFRKSGVLGY